MWRRAPGMQESGDDKDNLGSGRLCRHRFPTGIGLASRALQRAIPDLWLFLGRAECPRRIGSGCHTRRGAGVDLSTVSFGQIRFCTGLSIRRPHGAVLLGRRTYWLWSRNRMCQTRAASSRWKPGISSRSSAFSRSCSAYLSGRRVNRFGFLRGTGMREVVAAKFGIIVHDVFEEFTGGLAGITMDPQALEMKRDYSSIHLFKYL